MITVHKVSKGFGGRKLFDEVETTFAPGQRYGLTGPNGAGKSTFMRILIGEEESDEGRVSRPKRIGVIRQDQGRHDATRVIDVVLMGNARLWKNLQRRETLLAKAELTDEEGNELGEIESHIAEEDGYAAESDAAVMLEGLGIPQDLQGRPLGELKGGLKVRVLLAQALFGQPDALLLDEPTNHLDIASIAWLEEFLQAHDGVLVVISHDRHFLNAVCTDIADIDYESIIQYSGNYDNMVRAKSQIRGEIEKSNTRKMDKIKQLQDFVSRFGAGTRAAQASSRRKEIERLRPDEVKRSNIQRPYIRFDFEKPSGRDVLEVRKVAGGHGDVRVFSGLHLDIARGEKVAVIGKSGAGKTTLVRTLLGDLPRMQGSVKWGHEVNIGYFPQEHEDLIPPGYTVASWMFEQRPEAKIEGVRQVLGRMLFSGEDAERPTATLSGGERVRTLLARLMLLQHNVLILDEPTNHMDLEAISSLRDGVEAFNGTCIFVSHDRDLVESTANRVLLVEDGRVEVYPGGYAEYLRHQERA